MPVVMWIPRALGWARRHRPPVTVRLRLTALYGMLFLACGTVLLAITYGLFARQLQLRGPRGRAIPPEPVAPGALPWGRPRADVFRERLGQALAEQRADALHELLVQSALALGIVSVIAIALGWAMAGRVLRPLREVTATARRLSTHNLNERIRLSGPRDELRELADTFDAMLDRLGAAFEAQRRFVANASHELRTPLTTQRAAVDVALADPYPSVESLQIMAERVRAATRRHEHLIASLLTLARSERGLEHHDDVDLAETLRGALTAIAPNARARGLRLTSRLRPSPVRGDRALLERLAANLLDNAVRHNTPDGWVDARAGCEHGTVTLRVVNSGPVVPAHTVTTLFEPFRRLAPDRVGTGTDHGHGLGLSIVAAIANAHRGSYTAHPRPDGGLEVTITLPAQWARYGD
jgi:signal transduction histidine kinase